MKKVMYVMLLFLVTNSYAQRNDVANANFSPIASGAPELSTILSPLSWIYYSLWEPVGPNKSKSFAVNSGKRVMVNMIYGSGSGAANYEIRDSNGFLVGNIISGSSSGTITVGQSATTNFTAQTSSITVYISATAGFKTMVTVGYEN